jgi:hypothetical protein
MAISRNARRLKAKCRKALAEADRQNTESFLAKQAIIRDNCKALGRSANRTGTGGISWLDPTRKPLGYTRRLRFSHGVASPK